MRSAGGRRTTVNASVIGLSLTANTQSIFLVVGSQYSQFLVVDSQCPVILSVIDGLYQALLHSRHMGSLWCVASPELAARILLRSFRAARIAFEGGC